MKRVFAPGCALMIYKPQLGTRMLEYLNNELGVIDEHLICCRHNPEVSETTEIINVCSGCDKRYRQLYEGISTISLWEILAQCKSFPFPDYSGIQMTIQEFGTIMQTGVNVKVLILNNRFLGMVRQWQQLFHEKRYSFVNIESPDYVTVAKGYRIEGASINERKDLRKALSTMLNHNGSYMLEVMVAKEDNVFPMVPQGRGVSEIVLTKDDV